MRFVLTAIILSLTIALPALADPLPKATYPGWRELGLMAGPREPGALTVSPVNWDRAPYNRWSLQNMRAVLPTAVIRRGSGPVWALPPAEASLDGLQVTDAQGTDWQLGEVLAATYTDAFLVLKRGEIVTEQYFNGMTPQSEHLLFSVTKSYAGMLAGILVGEGTLDLAKLVTDYIPELEDTAWAETTVRDLLDMNTALDWDEGASDYEAQGLANPFTLWAAATWQIPVLPAYGDLADGAHDFLATLPRKDENKGAFHYKSMDTDMAGWVLEAASGESFADLLQSRIWSKIGAEQDTAIIVDQYGAAFPNYGLSISLRDMARVGLMMSTGGRRGTDQIVPEAYVRDITAGVTKEAWQKGGYEFLWKDGSYRSYWWVPGRGRGAYYGVGIHGQYLYIDPRSETVIVRFASQPKAVDGDMNRLIYRTFDAIIAHLEGK